MTIKDPVYVYRTWKVYYKYPIQKAGAVLAPGFRRMSKMFWPTEEAAATCENFDGKPLNSGHEVPDFNCGCGWYGSFVPPYDHVEVKQNWDAVDLVCGVALAYGKVVYHTKGLRAQYMRPVALWSPQATGLLIAQRWPDDRPMVWPAISPPWREAAAAYGCITQETEDEIQMWEEVIPYEYRRGSGGRDRGEALADARALEAARREAARATVASWGPELTILQNGLVQSMISFQDAVKAIAKTMSETVPDLKKLSKPLLDNDPKKGGD